MYKTNTSLDKLGGAKIFGWFFLLIVSFSGFSVTNKGLEKPDFRKPFKKCREFGVKNGRSIVIASDNDSQLIILNNASSLISIDPFTKLEDWRTEIRGELLPVTVSDKDSLFFIANLETNTKLNTSDEVKKEKGFTLNSISLKTGITRWQKIIDGSQQTEIKIFQHQYLLFITVDNKILSAFEKADGTLRWNKTFPDSISSLGSTIATDIKVLTENQLFRIRADTGEIVEEIRVENNSAKHSVLKENYLILGNSAGEVIKIVQSKGKSRISWKIKTGGSISNLTALSGGVLATSLDNFMYLFSPESGKIKWKRRVNGRISHSPLIFDNFAIVINSADNAATVISLQDGKVVNQLQIEGENYFSGISLVFKNFLILQTLKGIYLFSNTDAECP